jgi:hypothetical protein
MIAIISCSKQKVKRKGIKAKNLYSASPLFRLSYKYIKKYYPHLPIYILSAKYGLIKEDTIVDYYNKTFKDYSKKERIELSKQYKDLEDYVFIGGAIYKEILGKEPVRDIGGGLKIGQKLRFLKEELKK